MTALPTHLDHYTVDDLERVSAADTDNRYEVVNGSLYVTPPVAYAHNRRAQRLGAALAAVAPVELEVLNTGTQAIRIGQDGPCPDVVVFATGDYGLAIPAEAVRLIVEVTSPSNRSTDTVTKHDLYARAGIANYWVVDPDEVLVYSLDSTGAYRLTTSGAVVHVDAPFPMTVHLD